jgi:hypothetical protein
MIRRKIVSWSGAAAALALLLVATPRVFAQEPPKGLDGSHEALDASVAARFAAMQKLSARFSTPEAAGKLVDVLVARDAAAFNGLLGDLDLPLTGTCWWVHEIVEKAFAVATKKEKQCTLKEDMTGAERTLYVQLAIEYGQVGTILTEADPPTLDAFQQVVIPPGAFRDALEANGLVNCKEVEVPTGLAARPVVGKPFHFCFEPPPPR